MRIFICSPFREDHLGGRSTKRNTILVRLLCRAVALVGHLPVAPNLYFPEFLHEHDVNERAIGMTWGHKLMEGCDEVWVYTRDGKDPSTGMTLDIEHATVTGIPVYDWDGRINLLPLLERVTVKGVLDGKR